MLLIKNAIIKISVIVNNFQQLTLQLIANFCNSASHQSTL